jgi:hypothetical protein
LSPFDEIFVPNSFWTWYKSVSFSARRRFYRPQRDCVLVLLLLGLLIGRGAADRGWEERNGNRGKGSNWKIPILRHHPKASKCALNVASASFLAVFPSFASFDPLFSSSRWINRKKRSKVNPSISRDKDWERREDKPDEIGNKPTLSFFLSSFFSDFLFGSPIQDSKTLSRGREKSGKGESETWAMGIGRREKERVR